MEEQELEQSSVMSVSIKWGLILGVLLIAFGLVIQLAGMIGNQSVSMISYIFVIAAIYMAHKAYKDDGDGFMSYGQGLGIGTLTVLIGSVLGSIFSYINMKFIDTTIIETVKELQYEKMIEQGMSDVEIERTMDMSASFMTPGFIAIMAVVATVFFGFILSLIVSAITKNQNPADV